MEDMFDKYRTEEQRKQLRQLRSLGYVQKGHKYARELFGSQGLRNRILAKDPVYQGIITDHYESRMRNEQSKAKSIIAEVEEKHNDLYDKCNGYVSFMNHQKYQNQERIFLGTARTLR